MTRDEAIHILHSDVTDYPPARAEARRVLAADPMPLLLRGQRAAYQDETPRDGAIALPGEPCYVFDVDGTLADISHRLHLKAERPVGGGPRPGEWEFMDACANDAPIWPVIGLCRVLARVASIIAVTGRPEAWADMTYEWFKCYRVPVRELVMRGANDYRPDYEVKADLWRARVAPRFATLAVFDDRARVVAMWRKLGLPCFQVAEGDY